MMSSKTAEVGFVVEIPSDFNQFRLIIVAEGDTVQCFPTRDQPLARLGDSVLFEESPLHRTDPRTVVIKAFGVSTDVAKFTPDPEEEGSIIISTKVKSILPMHKNGKRLLKTNFFKSVPESEEMKKISRNSLINTEIRMRKVNFSRWEVMDFQLQKNFKKVKGIVFKRKGSILFLYAPGFSDDFKMDISHVTIDDDYVGKWFEFTPLSDVRTVDVSKEVRPFSEDPFITRADGSNAQIMMKCHLQNSSVFTEDFGEEVQDRYNVLEKYDLQSFDGRLWIQCLPDESTNSFSLVISKKQEQLGQPKPIPLKPVNVAQPVFQPPHPLPPPEKTPRAKSNRDSKRSRNPNNQECAYTYVKPGRKHNPDGTVALLHDERAGNRGRVTSSDRTFRSTSSKSASSSDGPHEADLIEENRELKKKNKKLAEQLEKALLELSKNSKTIASLTEDKSLLSALLDTTRREKARGDFLIDLMKHALVSCDTREHLANYDRRLAQDVDDAVFNRNFVPRQ